MNWKDYSDRELYVFFTEIPGLGCVSQNKLLREFGGIRELFEGSQVVTRMGKELRVFEAGKERSEVMERAQEILADCQKLGISVVTAEDKEYPARFRDLPDLPVVLYAKGALKINSFDRSIGIIGARRCSREGREMAIEIAEKAGREGVAIISGMARGIDSYANTAGIRTGGYTIAVLGSGPDICYPAENQPLYDAIADMGCLLSEYPPKTPVRSYAFPARNRIIAALSDTLYPIESAPSSGSATTIAAARKYNVAVMKVM